MDSLIIMGAGGSLFLVVILLFAWGSSCVLYARIVHPDAAREFIKLKSEINSGTAWATFSSAETCCTRCQFRYTSGEFETHMDATRGPFGHYSIRSTTLNLKDSDMQWLGEKAHDLAQRKRLMVFGKILTPS